MCSINDTDRNETVTGYALFDITLTCNGRCHKELTVLHLPLSGCTTTKLFRGCGWQLASCNANAFASCCLGQLLQVLLVAADVASCLLQVTVFVGAQALY